MPRYEKQAGATGLGGSGDDIDSWSMRKRLSVAANDYTDPDILLRLTEWVLQDLDESLTGFDTFASWKPNPPEERDVDILSALTKNESLPASAVDLIVLSGWWRLKPKILYSKSLSRTQLEDAFEHLVANQDSSIWQGASFSVAAETWYHAYVAQPAVTDAKLALLTEKAWGIPRIIYLVAMREDLDEDLFLKLAFHPNRLVRILVMRNPAAPHSAKATAALGN